jgi:hypothetical protein
MEYSTYRVLNKPTIYMEMEYSILTLTAREIFFKIPKSFTEKLVHTPWIGDIIGGIFQFMGYDNTDDNI